MTWLVEAGGAGSREEAVELGCEMMELGLIYHVTHRHGFSDKSYRLYRQASLWDDPAHPLSCSYYGHAGNMTALHPADPVEGP